MSEFQGISIQKSLMKRIEEEMAKRDGFTSKAEFIRYCIHKELSK